VSHDIDWERAKDLVHEALIRPPDDRAAFVRATCGSDEVLQAEVMSLLMAHADAIAAAHNRGIIHRDLKPANVMLTKTDVKLVDFGLAKLQNETNAAPFTGTEPLTRAGVIVGTLQYMAPEQLAGAPADARSDVWALGIVLYEMAAGIRPFGGHTGFEVSSTILAEGFPSLPTPTPVALKQVIARCLEKEPARRYQRANEVQAALEAIRSSEIEPSPARTRKRFDRRLWLVLAGTFLVALAALWLLTGVNVVRLRARLPYVGNASRIESLAVLPLTNLMGGADQEYYVAAMHEALITELGQIRALTVKSRTSVMHYRNGEKSVPEIARELNVDAVVEGSIFKAADRVSVRVRVIRARAVERQLWSQTFDGELQNVLIVQSSIARAIADQIQVAMRPGEVVRFASSRTVNPVAYDHWAKGWFQFNRMTAEPLHKCLEDAAAALSVDSDFAPAYALMATCTSVLPNVRRGTSPRRIPEGQGGGSSRA